MAYPIASIAAAAADRHTAEPAPPSSRSSAGCAQQRWVWAAYCPPGAASSAPAALGGHTGAPLLPAAYCLLVQAALEAGETVMQGRRGRRRLAQVGRQHQALDEREGAAVVAAYVLVVLGQFEDGEERVG